MIDITVDAAAPLFAHPRDIRRHAPAYRAGGVDVVLATVASIEHFAETASRLAAWTSVSRRGDLGARVATSVDDIERAHARGQLAVVLHMQGISATGTSLDALDLFHAAGVRVMQITYNHRNQLGDGCLEPSDSGLSEFGRRVVRRLNELGTMIDISHAGVRTSLETIDCAEGPVIASHSNARAVCESPRNLSDEHIRAVARTGGVIGLCAFPSFVSEHDPSLEKLVEHAAYIADLVGPAHVGLGLDFSDEDEDDYEYYGYEERYYPRPPWTWPMGIASPRDTANVPEALFRAGFGAPEVAGIMGGNFLRVFRERWGS